jgi:hypothetical protein
MLPSTIPIIVLGSPRSGTSLTGRLLSCWGAFGGEAHEHQPADEKNPRGYFEWMPLARFHIELFESVPVTPLHSEFEGHLIERSHEDRWRAAVARLVRRLESKSTCWFWKFPQYVLALPFWTRVLPDVRYIVCLREPRSICASMAPMYIPDDVARQVSSNKILMLLWQHHMSEVLRFMSEGAPPLFLSFEAMMASPQDECRRMVDFLGPAPADVARPSLLADLVRCVEPGLPSARADRNSVELTPRQTELWNVLQKSRSSPPSTVARDVALEPGERELVNAIFLVNHYHYRLQRSRSWRGFLEHKWTSVLHRYGLT